MSNKVCRLLIGMTVLLGCNMKLTPSQKRLYVIQELKLNGGMSFFWFRDEQQITHEGLSYFQITDDKCKLSVKKANAFCQLPEQITDFRNDTIFVLTRSDINTINPTKSYIINAVKYDNELYDINKRPKKEGMYFLDSVCNQVK